jgi:two-component system phosphate regulon sensor histidine kinase PhoR
MIKTASDIREEQFNQIVRNVLYDVSALLDQHEQNIALNSARLNRIPGVTLSEKFNVFPNDGKNSGAVSISSQYFNNGVISEYREEIQFSITQPNSAIQNGDELNEEILFGIESIYELRNQEKNRERWLNDKNWTKYKVLLEERPIRERIDSMILNEILENKFMESGIGLEYKYAVKNSNLGKDRIILGNPDFDPGRQKIYNQPLFQMDFNGPKPNYLYVYFPKRRGYLLRETGFTIIPTVILTAFLIAIFVYTILVIFRQKKLSIIKNDFINTMTHELKHPFQPFRVQARC